MAPLFGVTPERLAAAEQRTQAHCRAECERRWAVMRERDPARTPDAWPGCAPAGVRPPGLPHRPSPWSW
ncbi:hypothetical protein ACFWOG_25920 [Kitasatospora sp. NPDC058406]|uniref:hypothetical protein n=1 Tax=Kitasatospora sp. NPDC058406 TaxID=3346483 RepID=UPI00366344C4